MWVLLLASTGCDTVYASRDVRREVLGLSPDETIGIDDSGSGLLAEPVADYTLGGELSCVRFESDNFQCWYPDGAFDYLDTEPSGGPWIEVVAGQRHACALREGGAADCWGQESQFSGKGADEYFRAGPFDELRAGNSVGCGRQGASWSCWAFEPGWDADRPSLDNVTDLSVWDIGCAIRSNAVECWGDDGAPDATTFSEVAEPRRIEVGDGGVCVVDSAGTLWCAWNEFSQHASATAVAFGVDDFARPVSPGNPGVCWISAGTLDCFGSVAERVDDDVALPVTGPFSDVENNLLFGCGVLRNSGELQCWGVDASSAWPDELR